MRLLVSHSDPSLLELAAHCLTQLGLRQLGQDYDVGEREIAQEPALLPENPN